MVAQLMEVVKQYLVHGAYMDTLDALEEDCEKKENEEMEYEDELCLERWMTEGVEEL